MFFNGSFETYTIYFAIIDIYKTCYQPRSAMCVVHRERKEKNYMFKKKTYTVMQ